MRFHNITFGCQMNVGDADWLRFSLEARGWQHVSEDQAEVFLINTCSVREKPEQKVYSLLGRLQKAYWKGNPKIFVGVGGCVAQQIGETLWQRFPFVRLVYGTDGVPMVPQSLEKLRDTEGLRISLLDFMEQYPERDCHLPGTLPPQAFVNIMQGCDNYCAYCIVPFTRGRQKSRQTSAILEECRQLVARGVREITLLGQNVNSFGLDKHGDGTCFAQLLRQVADIDGLERLRFTTSHPKDIDPEVISAFGEVPKLCSHLHLPLQSGADAVLKSMGRKYTLEKYLRIVEELRRVCPQIALSTDMIVGFPGESEKDFEQTLQVMRMVGFESSFSFKYSSRPGTRAADFPNTVSEEEKNRRLFALQAVQAELTAAALKTRVGKQATVLVEGQSSKPSSDCWWQGRDEGGRIVHSQSQEKNLIGKMLPVQIVQANKHSLVAEAGGRPW